MALDIESLFVRHFRLENLDWSDWFNNMTIWRYILVVVGCLFMTISDANICEWYPVILDVFVCEFQQGGVDPPYTMCVGIFSFSVKPKFANLTSFVCVIQRLFLCWRSCETQRILLCRYLRCLSRHDIVSIISQDPHAHHASSCAFMI